VLDSAQTGVESVGGALSVLFSVSEARVHRGSDSILVEISKGAGFDGVVMGVLSAFLEEQSKSRLTPMVNRYYAVLGATGAATSAYLDGDKQMASILLSDTDRAAKTGDLTRFFAGGGR
jgi:hypothetical protein